MSTDCPRGNRWCVETQPDENDHVCESAPVELDSGWAVTLKDSDDGPSVWLSDPDCLLESIPTGRLGLLDALDLIVALAGAVHDAQGQPQSALHGAAG